MRIACPECTHQQTIADSQAGALVTCEECRHRFQAEAVAGIQEGLPPAKKRSADEEERRARNRDREERPVGSSGGGTAAIAIVSVVLIFFLMCGAGAIGGFFFAFMARHEEHRMVAVDMEVAVAKEMAQIEPGAAMDGIAKLPVIQPDLDVKPAADNQERIRNGDFEQGHKGFRTQYSFSPLNVRPELAYDIVSNPPDAHADAAKFGDHTSGKGKMLMVNGGHAIDQLVWGQTADVQPGSDYTLSLWVASWTVFAPAQIDVRINGKSIGQVTASPQTGEWKELRVTWNAGMSNTANIEIYDLNQAFSGNDFALDDISLRGPMAK